MRSLRLTALAALAAVFAAGLAGCGYHLSGHGEEQERLFSPILERVSIEGLGRYESFRKTLVITLRGYGVRVVAPSRASARLIFSARRERQRRSAVGDDAKAREHLLTVETTFSVVTTGKQPKTLLPEQTVQAEATYLADPDRPLLTANEKRAVMRDIETRLRRKITLHLAAIRHPRHSQ